VPDAAGEARALVGLSEAFFNKAQYPLAREYGLRGLELADRLGRLQEIGRANLTLAATAELQGDLSEAKLRAQRAITAFESAGHPRGRALATLELSRVDRLDASAYKQLIERAIEDARRAGDSNVEGQAAHDLGDRLFSVGDYDASFSALERAAALFTETKANSELGTVYNSLGRVYRAHGQFTVALDYQLKALDLHERDTDRFRTMQSLNAVAAVYGMLGEHEKARTYTERALAVAEQFGSPRVQDFLRANLATNLLFQGEYARAVPLLEGVIARGVDTNLHRRYAPLSFALRKMGRLDDALRVAQTAVDQCYAAADADCANALRRRAEAHLARGDTAAALADVTAALDRIEETRAKLLPSDFFKQEFVHQQEDIYTLAIALQLQQRRDRDALATAELARSRAFIDLLASRDIRLKDKDQSQVASFPTADARQRADGDAAANALKQLALTMRGAASPEATAAGTPASAGRELQSSVTATPAGATDLAAIARRLHSTVLAYWVAEDELFIWAVAPDGRVHTARVDVLASRLQALTRATVPFADAAPAAPELRTVTTRGGAQFAIGPIRVNAWRELYDLLIRPVRSALPGAPGALLTIVTHGPLAGLAFAALQSERGRYLLEDFTLHYAPAGAVLQFTDAKRRANARSAPVLVVADPLLPRGSRLDRPLPPLPGARAEARAIARQISVPRLTMLTGADATRTQVSKAVEGKAVVHFATHAIVRDDDPFESYLAFGSDGQSPTGVMTAKDVYRLNLDADLVVLSACRSGGGRVSGDGIAAFARAFIYAGTPSVIASVWDVPDQGTSTLLSTFYRSWLAGASKGRALRTAQLQVLRDLRAGRITVGTAAGKVVLPEHPIFWAGFSLIGEPE
jgi:CHAT domain-containing protein/tetratricopeptide (TPR) repeat protein